MGRIAKKLLTICLGCFTAPGFATVELSSTVPRNVQFTSVTTEQGLSSEFVHDIAQDQLGFIWFATQSGLNRYDGFDLDVFEHLVDDPDSISHSFVWDIYSESDGTLWLGTERGLNRYSHDGSGFEREPFANLELADYRIRQITQDARGHFWLGTLGEGLLRIDPDTSTLTQYRFDESDPTSLPNNHVMALLVNQRGELWVGTDGGGVARFDAGHERFVRYSSAEDSSRSLSDNRIRRLFEDSRGHLWVGTAAGGVNLFEPDVGRFTYYQNDPENPLSLPQGQVSGIYEDKAGTIWFGTESGLAEYRAEIDGFIHYRHDLADSHSLVNNRINVITQDASGVLWIGTHNGVSSWNYLSDTFTYYRSQDGYLNSDLVTDVAETSTGVLWVATYGGGLSRIDPITGEVQLFRHDEAVETSLPDDRVMVVYVDASDQLWVGTRGGGLARKVGEGQFEKFTYDANDQTSISSDAITSIVEGRDGGLWVGTFGGGLNYAPDLTQPRFEHLQYQSGDTASLSSDRVLKLFQDRAGEIWVGTEGNGLNRLDQDSRTFTRINLDPQGDAEKPRGTPWEILETPDRTLWIGTLGQGLIRWSANDRDQSLVEFEQFASANGLPGDVYGIVPGGAGKLWLSSNRGLFEFDVVNKQGRKFDRNNGLLGNEFSQGASLLSRSGQVMFGSNSGLVGFFPGDVPNNERVPVVSIEVNSRTDFLAQTWTGGEVPEIQLNYFDAFVAFEFVALDFVSPDKNEYRYRLLGLDSAWNIAKGYRQAIYSSLSPGRYRFQVEASNNDGVWNRHKSEVEVLVVPPPWSSRWAYVLYVSIALGFIGLVYNRQRSKRLAEIATRQHLERVVSERTAELADRNTELMSLNDQLEHASVTDALTGLRNRRFVDEHMSSEISKLRRKMFTEDAGESVPELLFLMMIDLDGFKSINDQFGHQAGDLALLAVKDRLLAICRKSDVVVRWGGDEFLIIGHGATISGIEQFTEKIRICLSATPYDVGEGNEGKLSGSIGVAPVPFLDNDLNFASWERICRIADAAAYLAKDSGRDAWVSVTGGKDCQIDDLTELRENLGELLEKRKIRLRSSRTLTHILG